jgi:hypothetical protein
MVNEGFSPDCLRQGAPDIELRLENRVANLGSTASTSP